MDKSTVNMWWESQSILLTRMNFRWNPMKSNSMAWTSLFFFLIRPHEKSDHIKSDPMEIPWIWGELPIEIRWQKPEKSCRPRRCCNEPWWMALWRKRSSRRSQNSEGSAWVRARLLSCQNRLSDELVSTIQFIWGGFWGIGKSLI